MSFTQEKRNYLHSKLDEVLRLWSRNSGQGYFNLVVNGGIPEFQFGVNLDMSDGLQPEHSPPSQPVLFVFQPDRILILQQGTAVYHAVVQHAKQEIEDEQLLIKRL